MTISAVIPAYNRRTQVFRAIDSILAQTLPVDEIIFVDDGSTDGTFDAVREHYGSRVSLFKEENSGASAARNRGLREAQGEWIAFLDSDDIWLPTKLERQFEALKALGSEYGACFTNCNYIGNSASNATVFDEAELKTDAEFGPLCDPLRFIVGSNGRFVLSLCVQSLVVRRSLVEEVGGFDEALGVSEDRDLLFRLSFKTKFGVLSTPLVSIDRTPDVPRLTGLFARMSDEAYAWRELVLKKMLEWPELEDGDLRKSLREELLALYYGGTAERLSHMRFRAALDSIQKIRRLGLGSRRIFLTLLTRAGGKLQRVLRERTGLLNKQVESR